MQYDSYYAAFTSSVVDVVTVSFMSRKSNASHPPGVHGRLAQRGKIGTGVVDTICTVPYCGCTSPTTILLVHIVYSHCAHVDV